MPKVFKTLANIAVWTMWFGAWIAFLFPLIFGGIVKGYLWKVAEAPMVYWVAYMVAIGAGLGSGVMMLIRKKLE